MNAPRLEACYFGTGPHADHWRRLADVLRFTAGQHCADWTIHVEAISPAPRQSPLGVPSHVANTQKMARWSEIIQTAADGDRVLLIDADTMILRSLDAVWDQSFDLAYTAKVGSRFPFNSGVVFVRVSPQSRAFILAWHKENDRMLANSAHHQGWRRRYGGINQAALGSLISDRDQYARPRQMPAITKTLQILPLPCLEWNCEDSSWPTFDPTVTRILHIKSALRKAVFERSTRSELAPLVDLWRTAERTNTAPMARTA